MAKFVVLVIVIAIVIAWLALGRRRVTGKPGASQRAAAAKPEAAAMLACAHCGVHLPQPEAVFDAAGRAYCTDAHRLAGPL